VPGSIEANARNELGTGVINSVEKSSGGRKGVLADPDPDKDPDDPVQTALAARTNGTGMLSGCRCELHNNRPNFARFILFPGTILQIAPAQREFHWEIGRLFCNSQ
jgi:hypothetical protein